jgi:hypothetical protein
VDGGQHRNACPGGFLGGVCLGAAHFSDDQDVGIEPERHIQQRGLVDALPLVFAVAGQGVDDAVAYPAVLIPHQRQLAGAVFNRKDPFSIGNGGQKPARQRSFSGGSGPCHAHGNAVAQALR